MSRRAYWCLVVPLYWCVVLYFLWRASPVFFDGGGPMPSFYWGHRPSPGLGEYYDHRLYYDFLFELPYFAASLIMTIVGCGIAPWLVRRFRPLSSRPFLGPATATLVVLLLLALVSDAGDLLGFWTGPSFLLGCSLSFFIVVGLAKTFLPASVLSGVAALGKRCISVSPHSPDSAATSLR